ncbi:hypothetical protein FA95DRAFT_1578997 [Auriscalpium vulgare]|uniref:Uncharacterized protein n=1 Tax=Auriscalpium vulgare TaxID=40419 RepID=A0ACB8SCC5_9AGAM|nr:hypothetical protein FA95DRAFT_1578997 [Auriscalpium vulgare]
MSTHRLDHTRASSSKASPDAPRPSASLIVVNARNEILLVQRNPQANAFAGVHVFPGGNYDAKQDGGSYEMTAIRETFEESGLLLASASSPSGQTKRLELSDALLDAARQAVHAQRMLFEHVLRAHQLCADVDALLPFTQWVTPPTSPRRFHTHFFVAFLPAADAAGFSSGVLQHRLPTPDGGQEVIAARFMHPAVALAEFRAHRIALMPPQYYLLATLADILDGDTARMDQHERVRRLSRSAFGKMVVSPRAQRASAGRSGHGVGPMVLTYEGDEVRGGAKGRLHRCEVHFGDGGVPTDIKLLRNFDIFTEIDWTSSVLPSKL